MNNSDRKLIRKSCWLLISLCFFVGFSASEGCKRQPKSSLSDSARFETDKDGNIYLEIFDIKKFASESVTDPLSVINVRVRDRNCTDQDLKLFTEFKNLEHLGLSRTQITSDAAPVIFNFANLTSLEVGDSKIDDRFFEQPGIAKLEAFGAANCGITPKALERFSSSYKLKYLNVGRNAEIDDDIFRYVGKLISLQDLRLNNTSIEGNGIELLYKCDLRKLHFAETPLSQDAVSKIADLKKLQELNVGWNPNVTDESMSAFRNHPTLFDLCIGKTAVTDDIFKVLVTIPNLGNLHIFECNISEQALLANFKKMPSIGYIDVLDLELSKKTKQILRNSGIQVYDLEQQEAEKSGDGFPIFK